MPLKMNNNNNLDDLEFNEKRQTTIQPTPVRKSIPLKLKFVSQNTAPTGALADTTVAQAKAEIEETSGTVKATPPTKVAQKSLTSESKPKVPTTQSELDKRQKAITQEETNSVQNDTDKNKNLDLQTSNTSINVQKHQSQQETQSVSELRPTHPMATMTWSLNLNASSNCQKFLDQIMDYCMLCSQPILIYGRLMPCKHVMCIQCTNANADLKVCLKEGCHELIMRTEKAVRGAIFVCNYDLDYKNWAHNIEKFRMQPEVSQRKLCGRSYMSQRDLLAHIQQRHC